LVVFLILIGVGVWYFLFTKAEGGKCTPDDDKLLDANAIEYTYKKDSDDKLMCMPSLCGDGYEVSGMTCAVIENNPEEEYIEEEPEEEEPPPDACLLTTKKSNQGAFCEGSSYRKTPEWCCSDYGRAKGYKWKAK
jgi:hypothetical protein|tara:strand:- start:1 stop:405 length:405 start_codon:yes stop_codon:yes gene_type:complete